MSKKLMILACMLLVLLAIVPLSAAAQPQATPKIKIGFVAGIVDPFYQVMEVGINQAVADFGLSVVSQYPPAPWGPNSQTPILNAMIARGDLDYLIIAPTDKDQMVAPLQAAADAGIKVITVDTFLGDGDYVNGPVKFPLSYIGSDNVEGGRIAAEALAQTLGEKGKVYVQNTTVGTSTTEQRGQGFKEGIAEYPNMQLVGMDYNLDDANTSAAQTAAVLQRVPDLGGIFGVNVFSATGASNAVINAGLGGQVQVVAFDATQDAIEKLRQGAISMVIAQKPYDMGYMAVEFAMADAAGVTSLPRRVPTGYQVITAKNVDDPAVARFIYQLPE
ncbi:MAG TPA: ABC transporter substrate-binding protein [Phototrophicaceae bacterium]|nr:ABC transporter substrate-binding protein [Phototrophicaceae bacterium]